MVDQLCWFFPLFAEEVLWNVSASILVAGCRVELFFLKKPPGQPLICITSQHHRNFFFFKFLLSICSRICQLKLEHNLSNIFWETFSLQKVKKCIFKVPKSPAEASISRVEFIFFIHPTNRKVFFLLQTETYPTSRMRPNVGRVIPNRRGKMAGLQGTLLLHSSYNTLPKNNKPSRDTDWLYRFIIILQGTSKPFYVFHNEHNKIH